MPRPIPTLAFLIEEADIEREQEAAAIIEEERLEAAHLEKYYSSFSDSGRYSHDHRAQDDFDDVDGDDSDVGSDYDDDWGDDQYYFNFEDWERDRFRAREQASDTMRPLSFFFDH